MLQTLENNEREPQPESRLWFAVLEQAVDDYRKGKYREELNLFFFGEGGNNGWFKWICDALDVDSEAVVKELRRPTK